MQDIVYFELNHWSPEDYYPNCEPYVTWMNDDVLQFRDQKWVKENKLVVVETLVDMSCNYCITAPREWVEKNCKEIITTHTKFLRESDENGNIYGQFGCPFLPYTEDNIGYWFAGWDQYDNWEPQRIED